MEPYLSEVRIFSFGFAPKGWAKCEGQFLPINQNQALFALLGTQFGGNGQTTFALPDLRGRVPVSIGGSMTAVGQKGGEETHTLSIGEMPMHSHVLNATSNNGTAQIPVGNLLATSPNQLYHQVDGNLTSTSALSVTTVGGSAPHINMMPYLVLSFCIALQGVFPTSD
jgi:microcystin-dependent protein